jgi:hypothetical protein
MLCVLVGPTRGGIWEKQYLIVAARLSRWNVVVGSQLPGDVEWGDVGTYT